MFDSYKKFHVLMILGCDIIIGTYYLTGTELRLNSVQIWVVGDYSA